MTRSVRTPAPEPRWLSAEQQRVWRCYLMASAKLAERLDEELRCLGVDLDEYEILVALEEVPLRRLRMSELAAAVHSSRSRLTHTISRLERNGLVQRINCADDRRGVWAQLTDAGMALLERAAPSHVASVRHHFVEAMTEDDYQALGRAFAGVLERSVRPLTYDRDDHGDRNPASAGAGRPGRRPEPTRRG
jgi:DNA-binding MarR family transcriptional regulator